MQKKVTNAKNKKAPNKGASNVVKKESIINYDVEVPKISKKELEKIKKSKK